VFSVSRTGFILLVSLTYFDGIGQNRTKFTGKTVLSCKRGVKVANT
jgi:hypothetical protein